MELDLTRLNSLALSDLTEKRPQKPPPEPLLTGGQDKTPKEQKEQAGGLVGAIEGIGELQEEVDTRTMARERGNEAYREYQHNIARSGQLQTEILKGIKSGENPYSLLLKAVHAISLMTSNKPLYSQIEAELIVKNNL